MKKTIIIILTLLIVPIAVTVTMRMGDDASLVEHLPESIQPVAMSPAVAMSDFQLTSHEKRTIGLGDFTGNWSFVFFGYTNCPDICPATLSQLVLVDKLLKKKYLGVSQPVFYLVSVDPERDTLEKLAAYIDYFNNDFVAMTGSAEQIKQFESQFGAFHRFENKDSNGNYSVAHSSETFLINPAGKIVAKFSPPMDIPQIAQQYTELVNFYQKPMS
jgi:protein SCO1/2